LAVSLVLRYVGGAWFIAACDGWAIVPWIAGTICLVYGWRMTAWASPALVFLLFMVPLPFRAEYLLSQPLQRFATLGSVWILQTFGEKAFAEGNVILLEEHMLEVERACAGLRIFVSVVALAFACAVISHRPMLQKVMLLASALPVAVAVNVLRIVMTSYAFNYGSTEFARGLAHDMAGVVMIPLALLFVIGVHCYLCRLFVEISPMNLADVVGPGRNVGGRAVGAS
jgi:exosortase